MLTWQLSPRVAHWRYGFAARTIRKNCVEFMCGRPVQLHPAGRKPKMDDAPVVRCILERGSLAWTPYKNEIMAFAAEQAPTGLLTHGTPTQKWWRGFKRRHPEPSQRTPSLADTHRVMSMLTKDQWEQWFHEHLRPALMAVGFNARSIFNEDESAFFMDWTPAAGVRKVFTWRRSKSVVRRAGYNRTHVTCMAAVARCGSQIPPTLLFKGTTQDWYDRATIPLYLCGTGTGWSSAKNVVDWIQHVFLREATP